MENTKIVSTSSSNRMWIAREDKRWRLTTEGRGPPLVDFGPGAVAGVGVGLQLVAQDALLTAEPTHVVHAALEERRGIHHSDALPGNQMGEGGGGTQMVPAR